MVPTYITRSAAMVARRRAEETERSPSDRLVYDPLSRLFVGSDPEQHFLFRRTMPRIELLDLIGRQAEGRRSRPEVLVRTKAVDVELARFLVSELRCGSRDASVFVIGAGLDTRAWRLGQLLADAQEVDGALAVLEALRQRKLRVTLYEVDFPSTLKAKGELFAEQQLTDSVIRVTIGEDLRGSRLALKTAMEACGDRCFVIMEGLLCWLPRDVGLAVMRDFVNDPRQSTHIVADFYPRSALRARESQKNEKPVMDWGQLWKYTGFHDPDDFRLLTTWNELRITPIGGPGGIDFYGRFSCDQESLCGIPVGAWLIVGNC